MFAKLYETEIGQILVLLNSDDNNCPEIRFYFKPKSLGVCSFALQYTDTDEGWDKAESVFSETTETIAFNIIKKTTKDLGIAL